MKVEPVRGTRRGSARQPFDWTPFVLSFLVPGAGHAAVGSIGRGVVWSLLLLAVVIPGAAMAFIIGCDAGALLLVTVPLVYLLFALACGASALRRSRHTAIAARRKPSLWVLETYAALVILALVLEVRGFIEGTVETCSVDTSALAPVLERGDWCLAVLSKYVRPVHGDVVLLRSTTSGPGGEPRAAGPSATRLARVLAGPGDRVERRGRKLVVNGIEVDLGRADQQHAIETAGRQLRQHFARAIRSVVERTPAPPGAPVSFAWEDDDAGVPAYLSQSALLVPDATGWEGKPRRALLVHKTDIIGRALR